MKTFKLFHFALIVLIIVGCDQLSKIYIKTHFLLGEEKFIIGDWFRLHFLENPGMAFGWTFWGEGSGPKIGLSILRLSIIIIGIYLMIKAIKKRTFFGVLFAWSMVIAGAIGNLIDSLFYGILFDESGNFFTKHYSTLFPKEGGYAGLFLGKVVDMLYFPIIQTKIPDWFPFWSGEDFIFFRPVFNIADSSITMGIILIIIMNNWVYKKKLPVIEKKEQNIG